MVCRLLLSSILAFSEQGHKDHWIDSKLFFNEAWLLSEIAILPHTVVTTVLNGSKQNVFQSIT